MKSFTESYKSIDDEQLFQIACRFGGKSLAWRRKFIGTLPEIYRRRLYERKGFESIFVFAQKVGGLSQKQVRDVLNLEKRFQSTLILKEMLVSGEVSINKLARVASIATRENEEALAEKVRVLPQKAIETFIRDVKLAKVIEEKNTRTSFLNEVPIFESQNGLCKPKIEAKSLRAQRLESLELSGEVTAKLLDLQGKGIDVNEFLLEALEQREKEIEQEKDEIAEELASEADANPATRYIPAKVKRLVNKEHGDKCSIAGCCKKAAVLHHTQAFALGKRHDPRFLAPLCHEHHAIAHSINVRASEMRQSVQMARRC